MSLCTIYNVTQNKLNLVNQKLFDYYCQAITARKLFLSYYTIRFQGLLTLKTVVILIQIEIFLKRYLSASM